MTLLTDLIIHKSIPPVLEAYTLKDDQGYFFTLNRVIQSFPFCFTGKPNRI